MRKPGAIAALLVLVLLLPSCKGADGVAGPQGAQGLQGPPGTNGLNGLPGPAGPGTRIVLTGIAGASGTVSVNLPAAVGSNVLSPPALACYLTSSPATGVWIVVSDGYWTVNTPWCGLTLSGATWIATMFNAPIGWTAAFVVVY